MRPSNSGRVVTRQYASASAFTRNSSTLPWLTRRERMSTSGLSTSVMPPPRPRVSYSGSASAPGSRGPTHPASRAITAAAATDAGSAHDGRRDVLSSTRRLRSCSARRATTATTPAFGRFGIYSGVAEKRGAIVELKCEMPRSPAALSSFSSPTTWPNNWPPARAQHGRRAARPAFPSKPGMTLRQVKDDMFNRIREVFNVGRFARIDGGTGGYSHNSGTVSGVLVGVEGGTDEAAKDVSMHIAAMRPQAVEQGRSRSGGRRQGARSPPGRRPRRRQAGEHCR